MFHERETVGPVDLDADCPDCGATLTFEYGTDCIGRVHCRDCGTRVLEWPFDPGGIADREPRAVVDAFDRRTRLVWSCALDGVCPFCTGRVDRGFVSGAHDAGACVGVVDGLERYEEHFARDHPALVSVDCDRCSFYSFVPVGVVLLTRPSVMGALEDAGFDVRATPLWDVDFVVNGDAVTVDSTTPWSVRVAVREGDAHFDAVLDERLEVELTNRA